MPLERDWRRRDAEIGLAVEIEIIGAAGGEIEALLTAPGISGAQLRRNRPDRVADRSIRFEEVGIEAARAAGIVIIKHPDIDAETVRQRLGIATVEIDLGATIAGQRHRVVDRRDEAADIETRRRIEVEVSMDSAGLVRRTDKRRGGQEG